MGLTRIRAQQISDLDYKQAVRVVTTDNITLVGGAPTTVDGVNLQVNNRILVTGQDLGRENGIYRVQTLGLGENGTWTRTSDANDTGEMQPGMVVMVTEGESYADTPWKLVTNGNIIIGETALTFQQFATGGSGTPGGSNTQIQYNNAGSFGASANLTWNGAELYVNGDGNITGNVTAAYFIGDGSQLTGISAGNVDLSAVAQDIVPAANITYDLGTATHRWRDIYLAGNTIDLGGAQIKSDAESGAIALVPAATESTPNPKALVISPAGAITPVETQGGVLDTGNIATAAANTSDAVIINATNIVSNLTIRANTNAISVGPITQAANTVISISSGQRWIIL
jgi:hypothetical protein